MSAEHDVDLVVQQSFFDNTDTGVLVEVGAARPDYLSISQSFRKRGWRIVSIEPNPSFCAEHRALGYDVLEYACGDRDADDVTFYVVDTKGNDYQGGTVSFESFSSLGVKDKYLDLQKTIETRTTEIKVKVRTLDTILRDHAPDVTNIDVLAVDVEGWEIAVIEGLDFKRHCPKVVILENLFDDEAYNKSMAERGYLLWKTIAPNEIYVRSDLSKKSLLQRVFRRFT